MVIFPTDLAARFFTILVTRLYTLSTREPKSACNVGQLFLRRTLTHEKFSVFAEIHAIIGFRPAKKVYTIPNKLNFHKNQYRNESLFYIIERISRISMQSTKGWSFWGVSVDCSQVSDNLKRLAFHRRRIYDFSQVCNRMIKIWDRIIWCICHLTMCRTTDVFSISYAGRSGTVWQWLNSHFKFLYLIRWRYHGLAGIFACELVPNCGALFKDDRNLLQIMPRT